MENEIICKKCGHNPKEGTYCPCSCHDRFRGKQFKDEKKALKTTLT